MGSRPGAARLSTHQASAWALQGEGTRPPRSSPPGATGSISWSTPTPARVSPVSDTCASPDRAPPPSLWGPPPLVQPAHARRLTGADLLPPAEWGPSPLGWCLSAVVNSSPVERVFITHVSQQILQNSSAIMNQCREVGDIVKETGSWREVSGGQLQSQRPQQGHAVQSLKPSVGTALGTLLCLDPQVPGRACI